MRILFAIREPYLPEVIGGGVLGMHHYALQLIEHGHECEVFATRSRTMNFRAVRILRKLSGRRWIHLWNRRDRQNGYVTNRADSGVILRLLAHHLNRYQPDAVITQGWAHEDIALRAIELGYPAVIRPVAATCVEALAKAQNQRRDVAAMLRGPHVLIMSASKFIAGRVRERLDVESPAVYEAIKVADPAPSGSPAEFITLVNPCVGKGLNVVLALAALLPHRKFLLLESWGLGQEDRQKLESKINRLPNVEFRGRTLDMKKIYQSTSLLLMPSQWEEAFGRVAVEAGAYGIPTLGSRIGGIPEAVGDGGVLLSPTDPAELWAMHVERILNDKSVYAELSRKARAHSTCPELRPDVAGQRFIDVIHDHVVRSRKARSLAAGALPGAVPDDCRGTSAALSV